ncbi:acyl-coenzyme A thioesterase 13-like [Clytia hemisphaerica]|uniref:acyl-coenzyme A thioesterase 13-like n=1 Tax=Clytia hemisphaerica TaxID=252671 RepID=UPI0034D63185
MAASRYLAAAQKAIKQVANHPTLKNYSTTILSPLKVVGATDEGVIKFNWKVEEKHLTPGGGLHGGLTAGIIDLTHGIGILAVSDCTQTATTLELNISYMRYVPNDELLDIESRVAKQGGRIAFMETTIMDSKGSIIATGKQTAMLVDVSKEY